MSRTENQFSKPSWRRSYRKYSPSLAVVKFRSRRTSYCKAVNLPHLGPSSLRLLSSNWRWVFSHWPWPRNRRRHHVWTSAHQTSTPFLPHSKRTILRILTGILQTLCCRMKALCLLHRKREKAQETLQSSGRQPYTTRRCRTLLNFIRVHIWEPLRHPHWLKAFPRPTSTNWRKISSVVMDRQPLLQL